MCSACIFALSMSELLFGGKSGEDQVFSALIASARKNRCKYMCFDLLHLDFDVLILPHNLTKS